MTEVNNYAVVELLRTRLGDLSHPDGQATASVLGKTSTMQPQMAEVVTKASERFSTAIVHTIEAEGWSIIRSSDLQDLRQKTTAPDPTKSVRVQCNTCGGQLFDLRLTNPQLATVNGATLRKHFRSETSEGCLCT